MPVVQRVALYAQFTPASIFFLLPWDGGEAAHSAGKNQPDAESFQPKDWNYPSQNW
jgi:hypothetical protein